MATTGAEVEVERIYLRYSHNQFFNFRIGRMYTPLGFWNFNYNFGLVLAPVISRPFILQPSHDGGFSLTRDAGVMIEGGKT